MLSTLEIISLSFALKISLVENFGETPGLQPTYNGTINNVIAINICFYSSTYLTIHRNTTVENDGS